MNLLNEIIYDIFKFNQAYLSMNLNDNIKNQLLNFDVKEVSCKNLKGVIHSKCYVIFIFENNIGDDLLPISKMLQKNNKDNFSGYTLSTFCDDDNQLEFIIDFKDV